MMTKIILATLASVMLALPATAQDAPPREDAVPQVVEETVEQNAGTAQVFQVARLGDNQMSCQALVTEINDLTTKMTDTQNRMTEQAMSATRGAMRGAPMQPGVSTAMGLAGAAAAFVPGGGLAMGVAGALAGAGQRAAMAAQQAQAQRDREAMLTGMQDGMALLGPISQRIDHLSNISRAKQC